ncbi:hypothetical protein KCMC57_64700 (plasmid) [Kitasatospora sp. CMC57]|uniref:Uncharacterized protein n=1 Tax=Kitasatospora sp. CMC57 TaxID=3231513 RepID=A0AB33K5R5_9ACTN
MGEKTTHRRRPASYLALMVRNELLRTIAQRHRAAKVVADESASRYQQLYLGGVHLIAGLQTELAHVHDQLAALEAMAERDAPMVSGWKVDLDAARAENRVLVARVVELEAAARAVRPLVASPVVIRAGLHQRLADAAGPAGVPTQPVQPVTPLWERGAVS